MSLFENQGYCCICMKTTTFVAENAWLRDHYVCRRCGAIPRQRALVEVLTLLRPNWRKLVIHESSPSMGFFFKECPGYTASQFFADVPGGEYRDGFRSENLEQMTIPSESFDVFITQDVFEHVFNPDLAMAEIMRVLRAGGIHVFTAPKHKSLLKTTRRAKLTDGRIEHLLEPVYHGNPIGDGKSLVTFDYGADFDDLVQEWSGYRTCNFIIRNRNLGIDGEYLDVFVTLKDRVNQVPPQSA
ncbi:MAG: class I SAM-dependent methyltransferase [Phycisphaerae bacterium]|nr:class I SAM-dependent methyltransferase [Phycisphaerae bacterium]